MTTATIDIQQLLESKPEVQGGAVVLRGTRVTVHGVVAAHLCHNMSLSEIVGENPGLTLAGLHAAMAYYYAHKAEMDAEEEADAAWGEEQVAKQERAWDAARQRNESPDAPSGS